MPSSKTPYIRDFRIRQRSRFPAESPPSARPQPPQIGFYQTNPFSQLTDTKPNHLHHPVANPSPPRNPFRVLRWKRRKSRRIRLRFRHVSQIKMRNSFILSMAPTVHYSLPKEKSL